MSLIATRWSSLQYVDEHRVIEKYFVKEDFFFLRVLVLFHELYEVFDPANEAEKHNLSCVPNREEVSKGEPFNIKLLVDLFEFFILLLDPFRLVLEEISW